MGQPANVIKKIGGELAQDEGGVGTANRLFDFAVSFQKPAADGAAGTATASTKGNGVNGINGSFSNPFDFDLAVVGFLISPNAALVADNANYATIAVETDDAADGAPAAALSVTTQVAAPGSNTWATDVCQRVDLSTVGTKGVLGTAQRLRPGANLFLSIAKTGTGVVVPICNITVLLRRL
jgi:hypothetical protein